MNRKKNKKHTVFGHISKLREIPVFFSYLIIVVCFLLIAASMMIINSKVFMDILSEKNLEKLQDSLEKDCAYISSTFAEAYSIPSIIEQTRYYSYLNPVETGSMPDKYAAVLSYLGKALQTHSFLTTESDECLIYLKRYNSICGKSHAFMRADTCFEEYISFANTSSEEVLSLLRGDDGMTIIPMQDVTTGMAQTRRNLAVVIAQDKSQISMLCTYAESTLLEHLSFEQLPDGSFLQIVSGKGVELLSYPSEITEEITQSCYTVSASIPYLLQSEVLLYIPQSYFQELLKPVNMISWNMLFLMMVLGLGLSLCMSRFFTVPIREIMDTYKTKADDVFVGNEIRYFGNLLQHSNRQIENLQQDRIEKILMLGFAGSPLSPSDCEVLRKHLRWEEHVPYRVSIIQAKDPLSESNMMECVQSQCSNASCVSIVGEREIGLLLLDDYTSMSQLQNFASVMEQNGTGVHIGISGLSNDLMELSSAVRQARTAIFRPISYNVYSTRASTDGAVSWLQHERLYQSILFQDKAKAKELLAQMADETRNHNNYQELFYSIRYLINRAAEELNVPFDLMDVIEYTRGIPAWENIENLQSMLDQLFLKLEQKRRNNQRNEDTLILDYIHKQLSDYNLCLASVAHHFDVPEKVVYDAVIRLTGERFSEYLTTTRLKYAAKLLCTSQMSITEVRAASGFLADSTFYRVFKSQYGVTPSQFRKNEH